ncbi:hypothetical protein TVAG_081700 [Trichomonas vaginalis G3]|uniref:Uncharacterized protein n=1 Tax=Trichomonas vaginalis (strain ATCC PRA-98 / G3) TaxID=412133 RepID=A2E6W2_TRIV3|nr:hypothetical protein TVAGG3_0493090 [Trichomonas vaginalis G3]EAY11598.1 hypothetical protein TVAG_081700 [Trichomonas vaginalis G3]KAI5516519.1 hypothetical protein TVAGG3_0493090 [Trichomonas vaginalis G3]|eukprot:XP_001323821.1 hypothetical protein [Trichomonas vaginalis G3]
MSWLDKMASQAGVLEEEEEEEEEIEQENPVSEPVSEEKQIENAVPPVENPPPEEKAPEKKTQNHYFTGKSTKHNVNFVRKLKKVQIEQDKAYETALQKCSLNITSAYDYAQNPLKYSGKIISNSKNAKGAYSELSKSILALDWPYIHH